LIGLIGLFTDVILASIGRQLFPWMRTSRAGWLSPVMKLLQRGGDRRAAIVAAAAAEAMGGPAVEEPTIHAGEVVS
jgi:hypothetical protein